MSSHEKLEYALFRTGVPIPLCYFDAEFAVDRCSDYELVSSILTNPTPMAKLVFLIKVNRGNTEFCDLCGTTLSLEEFIRMRDSVAMLT